MLRRQLRSYDRWMHPSRPRAHDWADAEWHAPWWDPEREARKFQSPRSKRFRLLFPVVISLFVQVPSVFFSWTRQQGASRVEWETPLAAVLAIGLALVGPVALLFARRFPGPVVVLVGIAASADLLVAGAEDGPPYISFAFAIGSAIIRGARIWAWATIAVSWFGTLIAASLLGLDWQPWRVVGISIGILLVLGFAEGMRGRRERIEQLSLRVAARRQTEVQAERVRIARELHDVLAHSLSQINVQAGVGLHLIDKQPEKARDALANIKESSKTALDEVRSVLGILRADGSGDAPLVPEPDLSRLEGLAASVTAQAVAVTLRADVAEVSKPVQLALYRIVQESLTNVVRHANATRVSVDLTEQNGSYRLVIADNGAGALSTTEGGRGLLGMRERAELLGGTLDAAPGPTGGFTVSATIPRAVAP